jgi:hypothetical protein
VRACVPVCVRACVHACVRQGFGLTADTFSQEPDIVYCSLDFDKGSAILVIVSVNVNIRPQIHFPLAGRMAETRENIRVKASVLSGSVASGVQMWTPRSPILTEPCRCSARALQPFHTILSQLKSQHHLSDPL